MVLPDVIRLGANQVSADAVLNSSISQPPDPMPNSGRAAIVRQNVNTQRVVEGSWLGPI